MTSFTELEMISQAGHPLREAASDAPVALRDPVAPPQLSVQMPRKSFTTCHGAWLHVAPRGLDRDSDSDRDCASAEVTLKRSSRSSLTQVINSEGRVG